MGSRWGCRTSAFVRPCTAVLIAQFSASVFAAPPTELPQSAREEIRVLLEEKASWTPTQQKMESQLIHAVRSQSGKALAAGLSHLQPDVRFEADGRVLVDLDASVTPGLLALIRGNGGHVINSHPGFRAIRALVPVNQLETLASSAEVKSVRRADRAHTNIGPRNSEGDVTHLAAAARSAFGVTGSGVKIGVLSDSVDYLVTSQAIGELGTVTVLPGQSGVPGSGEGTAMLEVVHDLAPGAQLYYATAFNGQASFAQNILNLRNAGCDIIVDDVIYFNESPFQDGIIAQAVNTVTASGALFFSAAGNSGNLDASSSGTWEGDFVNGGVGSGPIGGAGQIHSFGALNYVTVTSGSGHGDLFWADPLGASTNDYDLFVLNSTGTSVLRASMTRQTGTQDPYESVSFLNAGERIVIVKYSGAGRFLHLDTMGGRLSVSTSGATRGHSAAAGALSVAAAPVSSAYPGFFTGGFANPVEGFSADGPRHVFFNADGAAITPGDFSSAGGALRQKPDMTAADGVMTSVYGFRPFYGTSAAAPHAAAIAALAWSYDHTLTAAQIRDALMTTSLNGGSPGVDRTFGAGLVMAYPTLALLSGTAPPSIAFSPADQAVPIGGTAVFAVLAVGEPPLAYFWKRDGTAIPGETSNMLTLPHTVFSDSGAHFTCLVSNAYGTVLSSNVLLTVTSEDYFTELFGPGHPNDLAFQSFTFTPNESLNFYYLCREPATEFPTDPTGGNAIPLGDDNYAQVTLSGGSTVSIYGRRTNVFFVSANGYITLDSGDSAYAESLANHFNRPRVSALFDDLYPPGGGPVSFKALSDRVAVTYRNVPEFGTSNTNSFQIEMFYDGRIRLTYLQVDAKDGLVGISAGEGIPNLDVSSDLTGYLSCSALADANGDGIPDEWIKAHQFEPNDPTVAQGDPDGDGLASLMEYAVGTDPHDGSDSKQGIVSSVTSSGGAQFQSMAFKRRRLAPGLQYIPETSADGRIWNSDPAHIQQLSVTPLDDQFDWVVVQDAMPVSPGAPRFMRLRVRYN